MALEAALYLVSTPIGTADDITLRALTILREADLLAAEDTRTLRRLMEIHGVPLAGRPLVAYHDHNGAAQRPRLIEALRAGRSVAFTADAGTPLVADPGFALARDVREAGIAVRAAPGPSALLAALSVAGLPTDRFLFAGFLPVKQAARRRALAELSAVNATLVFYESPRRVGASLADMAQVLGGAREAAMTRELTKRFEEVRRGSLDALAAALSDGPAPKGEIVLVIGPPPKRALDEAELLARLKVARQTLSVRDAAQKVHDETGHPRKALYAMAMKI